MQFFLVAQVVGHLEEKVSYGVSHFREIYCGTNVACCLTLSSSQMI